jgi:2'-5' RNA ligase
MTPAPLQHRLFFALWPDAATCSALLQRQIKLDGKRVEAQKLHLTLAFLGSRPERELPALRRILQRVPAQAMTLELDAYGYFSGPRIAWAGMAAPAPQLLQLHGALLQALAAEGIVPQTGAQQSYPHRFEPHVTLAKKASPAALPFAPLRWRADRIVLAESTPESGDYAIIASRRLD